MEIEKKNSFVVLKWNQVFEGEDVNQTFRYPFTMVDQVQSLTLQVKVTQPEKSSSYKDPRLDAIGVGISHNGKIRCWNCCHKEYLKVSKEYGDPGTIPGEFPIGEWEVLVFPRTKNQLSRVQVFIQITMELKHRHLVKGDTHLHSLHSDGSLPIHKIAQIAKDEWLDYVFITDHNISSANYNLPKDQGILIGPGIEYGVEAGHMSILGETTPVEDFTWNKNNSCYEEVVNEIKKTQCGVGMNHPFCHDSPWRLSKELDFDWVEVWNGMWRPVNDRALRWWHDELTKGRRLPIIGGSDTHHNPHPFGKHGMPTTQAYVEELTAKELVKAFKSGHVFITMDPNGPQIDMVTPSGQHMGDMTDDNEVDIRLEGLIKGDCIYLCTKSLKKEYVVTEENVSITYFKEDTPFIYIVVKRRMEVSNYVADMNYAVWNTVLLSNPIYFSNEGGQFNEAKS